MEKQERLLKKKPEIVVGTPGRLWELMSSGNQHLVEVSVWTSGSICQVVIVDFGNSVYD